VTTLKLTAIGTSTGVIIPKAMLDRMNVGKGDVLFAVEAPDGSYRLTPYDPEFARKMEKAEDIMRRYRNTLHVLAQ
jgi:putative addiction module antidote